MIDLNKFTKVYEWNSYYGTVFKRWFLSGNVVSLIKIGDGYLIEATDCLQSSYELHLRLLRKNKHPNSKMSEYFSAYRTFEVYILEQIDIFARPSVRLNSYLSNYKPNLNDAEKVIGLDVSSWDNYCKDVMVGVKMGSWLMNGIRETSEIHGLSINDVIYGAVDHFMKTYTGHDSWRLTQSGAVLIGKANMDDNI